LDHGHSEVAKRAVISDDDTVSAGWALTVGGFSGPGLPTQPSCLGTASIDAETSSETSVLATAVAGAWSTPTAGVILSSKLLRG